MPIVRPDRPLQRQQFRAFSLAVPAATAVTLSSGIAQSSIDLLITAFTICVPAAAGANVWFGDASIDPALFNGIEIVAGTSKSFAVTTERQLYELQEPLMRLTCEAMGFAVPMSVWDTSTIYLRAAGAVPITVGGALFMESFK